MKHKETFVTKVLEHQSKHPLFVSFDVDLVMQLASPMVCSASAFKSMNSIGILNAEYLDRFLNQDLEDGGLVNIGALKFFQICW